VGDDIVFAAGKYAPDTRAGQSLLAHELTHMLQPARTGTSAGPDGIRVSDPSDRDEVEAAEVARRFDGRGRAGRLRSRARAGRGRPGAA